MRIVQRMIDHSFRGLSPLGPLPGLCLGPAGDLKRSPDPSPTHAPLTTNPGSAPFGYCPSGWIFSFRRLIHTLKTYDSTVLVYRQTKAEIVGESIYESTNTPNVYLQESYVFNE
jgi:hypothetical protein